MRRVGFTTKLLLAIAVVVAAALGVAFGAVHRGTESNLENRLDDDLRAKTAEIESMLAGAGPGDVFADAQQEAGAGGFGRTSQLVAIIVPGAGTATNQPELLGRPGDGEAEGEEEEPGEEHEEAARILAVPEGFSEVDLDEAGEVRLLRTETAGAPGGPPATIIVGQPTASIDRALDGLSRTFLIVGALTLVAALVAGAFIASRLTAPLRRMAADTERIEADAIERVEVPGAHDELRQLAEALNSTLARLQQAFEGQKRFVADASHELRTPLTVIRGQLEVLARTRAPSDEEVDRVAALVTTEVDRMERMVEDMLALAKGEQRARADRRPIDLTAVAVEAFDSMAVTADRTLEKGELAQVRTLADPEQVAQLVRILARNAIEHTEPKGWIRLSVERADGSALVVLEDDGPGIPVEEREAVLERFHRAGAGSRGQGAGLGLAIARSIAESHGGSIAIDASERGGVRVAVAIPVVGAAGATE